MEHIKSLDEHKLIAALLHDISNVHGSVFDRRACRNTCKQVERRTRLEGLGFLTKTLPRLAKAFDKALAGDTLLNTNRLGFKTLVDSELPRFLGEFFSRVLSKDGTVLPHPCSDSVRVIRQVLYLFYKYELPYTEEQEQDVLSRFEKTEKEISNMAPQFQEIGKDVATSYSVRRTNQVDRSTAQIVREARILLQALFKSFDPSDIIPRHGPGVVATKQRYSGKYLWSNVSANITSCYPFDAYFRASLGHVCDSYRDFEKVTDMDLPAKVILVPKDSRGPRLISCEPVDYQWIQQGMMRSLVRLVESHPLTRERVNFTDQSLNQFYALVSSRYGRYATLDLNEASDRVSVDLVRLLFPEHVFTYLMACRSSSTVLPDGRVIPLQKFAPMGSAICFPILALTVWALLSAGIPDAHASNDVIVYGDDVIVPTAQAVRAMNILESFGLKINRDKSCTSGLFRESCGTDAFNGVNVTPVRIRTVWTSSPSPEAYTSWISYANSMWDKHYYATYDYIVRGLHHVYGAIPDESMSLTCPSLRLVADEKKPNKRRWNKSLQKLQFHVYDIKSPVLKEEIDGWSMLLRYFTEASSSPAFDTFTRRQVNVGKITDSSVPLPLSVRLYTKRRASMLVRRWR